MDSENGVDYNLRVPIVGEFTPESFRERSRKIGERERERMESEARVASKKGEKELSDAAYQMDFKKVSSLLQKGVCPNVYTKVRRK